MVTRAQLACLVPSGISFAVAFFCFWLLHLPASDLGKRISAVFLCQAAEWLPYRIWNSPTVQNCDHGHSYPGTRGPISFGQRFFQPERPHTVPCMISTGNASFPVFPISFSVPKEHLSFENDYLSVQPPFRSRNFAAIVPGQKSTYTFQTQQEYYEGYKTSMFALTRKKAGWDCLRHLEIIANGCMPYMLDADLLPLGTMFRWPREALQAVLRLGGVNHAAVQKYAEVGTSLPEVSDADLVIKNQFNITLYFKLLRGLQAQVREFLTTEAMANYLLSFLQDVQITTVLYVGSPNATTHYPDYMACTLFHGMRSVLGSQVVDFPKRDWMYSNYNQDRSFVYGHGFTYAFLLDDLSVARDNVLDRLKGGVFSHVIFSVTHNGFDQTLLDSVLQHMNPRQVFFIDGSDQGLTDSMSGLSGHLCIHAGTCFRRELNCEL